MNEIQTNRFNTVNNKLNRSSLVQNVFLYYLNYMNIPLICSTHKSLAIMAHLRFLLFLIYRVRESFLCNFYFVSEISIAR